MSKIISARIQVQFNDLGFDSQDQLEAMLKAVSAAVKSVSPGATFHPNVEVDIQLPKKEAVGATSDGGGGVFHMMKVEKKGQPVRYVRLIPERKEGNSQYCREEEITEEEYLAAHKSNPDRSLKVD